MQCWLRKRSACLTLAATIFVLAALARQVNAITKRLDPTIPTRTPVYTIPPRLTDTATPRPTGTSTPRPTSTSLPQPTGTSSPNPTNTSAPSPTRDTPGLPGPSSTPPAGTATPPAATLLPPATALPAPGTPTKPGKIDTPQPPIEVPATSALTCSAQVARQDVRPGEQVEYAVLITNTGTGPAGSVALQDLIAPGIEIRRIRATQGAVDVEGGLVTLRLGIIEAGQSALALLDLEVSPSAAAGQVFVQQAAIYSDDSQTTCGTVAFGTQPDHLPATGAERKGP